MYLQNVLPLLLLALCVHHKTPPADGARILAAYIFPGKSHFMMHNTLVRELVKRGHQVTYLTPFSLISEHLGGNYTEVLIPVYDFWTDVQKLFDVDNLFELTKMSTLDFLKMMETVGIKSTEFALKQPNIQRIINANVTEEHYDLLLAEQFYNEAFLALAYKYNIPVVTTSTFGYANFMSQMVGIVSPWSFVPHAFFPFSDRMNFWERVRNSFVSFYEDMFRKYVYMPQQEALVHQYFSHLPVHLPSVERMENNISAMLLNSYMPLVTSRPTSFNMIPIGGLHINPPKTLPPDMQNFLDEAQHGAIYFSLGSNVRSSDMPPEKQQMFLDVFAGLKQRVLWKYEAEDLANIPANVMIKKWLPQSDILAHANIKIFITHGGLFGTQEAVHYGVPMLGMPIYCDQHLNMNKAVQGGYALSLHFQSMTVNTLQLALNQLLEDPQYKTNMARVSRQFRDRPMDAKDTAIYWIEYVIRHKGAPHIRSAGVELSGFQFYLLDVFALLLVAIIVPLVMLYFIYRRCKKSWPKLKTS